MPLNEPDLHGMSTADRGGLLGVEVRRCWYCGTTTGAFENEHQRPVSRGGRYRDNLVRSCAACNHLKGKLTLEEFRTALERRLGVSPVVFAGEAEPGRPATPIGSVRSLAGTPEWSSSIRWWASVSTGL